MTSHDASSSALGYLYQTDWALLEMLREARTRPGQAMTLELFDDVAWDADGEVSELLQLKHHQNSVGNLSDKSVDIWKTLKVWLDSPTFVADSGPMLTLVTTNVPQPGTAASHLLPEDRDPVMAMDLLDSAAKESTSQTTGAARSAWLAIPRSSRLSMTQRITVVCGAPLVGDIEQGVREEINWALPLGQEDTFISLLWQWWRKVSLDLLQKKRDKVNVIEVQQQVQYIRDMFVPDSLPTLVELHEIDEDRLLQIHDAHDFVHQLRWINVGTPQLRKAISDYYRAVTQITRWIDRSLVDLHELKVFEDNLVDEWERAFEDMVEDLNGADDESIRQDLGKALWRKLRDSTSVSVRSRYTESFFARGIRHELADRHLIGWHPDFEARIRTLIEGRPQRV